jgi:hypothetical protein
MALGTIFVVTPVLGWSWPALAPLITATAAALGYNQVTSPSVSRARTGVLGKAQAKRRTAVLPLEAVLLEPVADEVKREQRLVYERDGVEVVFRRDVRGKFLVEVSGPESWTLAELRARGQEFALALVRQFAHNRVVQELERRGMIIVGEEVAENGDIVVRARRWS